MNLTNLITIISSGIIGFFFLILSIVLIDMVIRSRKDSKDSKDSKDNRNNCLLDKQILDIIDSSKNTEKGSTMYPSDITISRSESRKAFEMIEATFNMSFKYTGYALDAINANDEHKRKIYDDFAQEEFAKAEGMMKMFNALMGTDYSNVDFI